MDPWEEIAHATTPHGDTLNLRRRGAEFEIRINGWELMSTRNAVSETAFAPLVCADLRRPTPRVLIGGLGIGYTLRAALDTLGPDARVIVCELVPAIVAWNAGPLAPLAGRALADARVEVRVASVADAIAHREMPFDAILLDVDNGPDAVLYAPNHALYSESGLMGIAQALVPGGVLGVWSADRSRTFEAALARSGMAWRSVEVPIAGDRPGLAHTIYLARTAG